MLHALALAALCCAAQAARPGYLRYSDLTPGTPYTVHYDNRSLFVAGQRTLFASAGIHYPRFSPGQWDDVILKAQNDGYNIIQTYFFVNAHAPKGEWPWSFEGSANLHLFLQKVAAAGLFVNLRIGPYVCAEWSWGGYPYNLAEIPGVATRSSNAAWEAWMRALVLNVTAEFRSYFADRGGPIVLGQIENELHTSDQAYIDFCGELADETGVSIAWGMCNGNSASNTINTCNSGDCTSFIESNGQNGKVLITQPAVRWPRAAPPLCAPPPPHTHTRHTIHPPTPFLPAPPHLAPSAAVDGELDGVVLLLGGWRPRCQLAQL